MAFIKLNDNLYSPEKIKIDRNIKDFPNSVVVSNSLSETIFVCDQSWTDEQINKTVEIANHAFKLGQMKGSGDTLDKIKNYAESEKTKLNIN